MKIGIPKESFDHESRVALIPDAAAQLVSKGFEVCFESNCGHAAGFPNDDYQEKGATLASRTELFEQCDLILQVRTVGSDPHNTEDLKLLRDGQVLIGFCDPLSCPQTVQTLAQRGVSLFSMELMPRITRAQSMDALSSMATVAGYKAVLLAAEHLPRFFPMFMTAAGTVAAAKVFVVGAGVAGLQALATAKRLGAVTSAYDVRPVVKEQVESVGARFVEMDLSPSDSEDKGGYAKEMGEEFYRKQRELMTRVVSDHDVVITTAAIPGKKSPVLITADMIDGMRPGSVIVDLAAERGGNCESTCADKVVERNCVKIFGPTNLPSTVPYHASQMYCKNVCTFLNHITKDASLVIDMDDEITAGTLLTRAGEVIHPRIRGMLDTENATMVESTSDGN